MCGMWCVMCEVNHGGVGGWVWYRAAANTHASSCEEKEKARSPIPKSVSATFSRGGKSKAQLPQTPSPNTCKPHKPNNLCRFQDF